MTRDLPMPKDLPADAVFTVTVHNGVANLGGPHWHCRITASERNDRGEAALPPQLCEDRHTVSVLDTSADAALCRAVAAWTERHGADETADLLSGDGAPSIDTPEPEVTT